MFPSASTCIVSLRSKLTQEVRATRLYQQIKYSCRKDSVACCRHKAYLNYYDFPSPLWLWAPAGERTSLDAQGWFCTPLQVVAAGDRSGEGHLLLVAVVSTWVAAAVVSSVCLARLPHSWLFGQR